VLKELLCLGIW